MCSHCRSHWGDFSKKKKKLTLDLVYDPATALWGIYPEDSQVNLSQGYLNISVYCRTVHKSQVMETISMSNKRRMDKEIF